MTEKTTEAGKVAQEVADVVEQKAANLTEFSMDKMEQFFDAAQKVLAQYGGDVAELGLNVLRIEAASELILPLVFVVAAIVVALNLRRMRSINCEVLSILNKDYGARYSWDKDILKAHNLDPHACFSGLTQEQKDKVMATASPAPFFADSNLPQAITGVATLVVGLFSLSLLINLWAWVGIFYPELYAVHKFLL